MRGNIRLPELVFIESCGVIECEGQVQPVSPAMVKRLNIWPADQDLEHQVRLQWLHHGRWELHSRETVELCQAIMSRANSKVSLVYAHRSHRCEWKTPLLQSLLAQLGPGVQAHGLQVDQDYLPLDLVLFGVASIADFQCCMILKDNTIRVGAEEVVEVSTLQYLVLSRGCGSWTIDGIVIDDEELASSSTTAALSLDGFLAAGERGMDSVALTGRMANGCLGVLRLVRGKQADCGPNSSH
jgi:hypothetical protein